MSPLLKPLLWHEEDSQNWLAFVQTATGQKLLTILCEAEPSSGMTTDAVRALGLIEGHRQVVTVLKELTKVIPPPAQPPEQYPDLDDDSKWTNKV